MKKLTLLFIFCLAFVSLFVTGCPKKDGFDKSDWWTGNFTTKNAKSTPRGVTVYSYETVTASNLEAIDSGLERVFDIASRVYSYQNGLNYSDYRIVIFKRSALCTGTAVGFAVRADNYDGTEYDKDPRPGIGAVCAAGLSAEFEQPMAVVVQDDPTIALATRFEGEHLILYKNDRWKWQETMTHSTGGHPLLPDTDGSRRKELSLNDAGITEFSFNDSEVSLLENPDLKIEKGNRVCLFLVK